MENKEVNNKNSNNKIFVVLVVIAVLLGLLVGGLATYTYLTTNNNVTEEKDNDEKKNEDGEKEVNEEDENEDLPVLDDSKNYPEGAINVTGYKYNYINENGSMMGIKGYLKDSRTVVFDVDGQVYGPTRGSMINRQGGVVDTNNFTLVYTSQAEISNVFIGGFGHAVGGNEYIFLLMKDGTVQYKSIFNKNVDGSGNVYFTTDINAGSTLTGFTTLNGVKDGIKLANANRYSDMSSGMNTVLVYVDEDSFYDLAAYLVK